jgi:hypothetical protein
MSQNVRRLGAIALATSLLIAAGLGIAASASGKKKGKPLKVSCDQLYAEIDKTGAQLQQQYNAMGFTIGTPSPAEPTLPPEDGFLHKNACQKEGKRVRMGGGFMNDIHSEGEPPFPGETNPAIREYFWTWSQTVRITKKRKLISTVTDIRCEKYIYEGSPGDPHGIQSFPC